MILCTIHADDTGQAYDRYRTMELTERFYPIGIQTFSEIIREGYVYVDKTDLMWRLQYKRKYIFLSRPRRFGKSLLSSTFHSFFDGDRELFEGLKVMQLEKEWKQYAIGRRPSSPRRCSRA